MAAVSTHFAKRLYPAVDAADKESCLPDFRVGLYPGHLSLSYNSFGLNPDIDSHIIRDTPPTFLLQNEDDNVDRIEDALSYFAALKRVGSQSRCMYMRLAGMRSGLSAAFVRFRLYCFILLAVTICVSANASEVERSFDIAAGQASVTLEEFSAQADAQLLFSVEAVAGVKTNLVKGAYTAREALEHMLVGTGLVITQNGNDEIFAVNRAVPKNSAHPKKMTVMKTPHTLLALLTALVVYVGSSNLPAQTGGSGANADAPEQSKQENPIILNPFEVAASSDVGYGATETSSTSKIAQAYIDVPQSVNVLTRECFQTG